MGEYSCVIHALPKRWSAYKKNRRESWHLIFKKRSDEIYITVIKKSDRLLKNKKYERLTSTSYTTKERQKVRKKLRDIVNTVESCHMELI